jgi:hypothetical protein
MLFLERMPCHGCARDPGRSQLNRVTRPVLPFMPVPRCTPREAAPIQRPNSHIGPGFGSILAPGKGSESGANSPDHPCLFRRSEWSFWNPVREFGGTENHPAPNDPKLGRLRCARQGLVRVPESNTKYGGKGGKPRGHAAPRLAASIGESCRIPKWKKFVPGCEFKLPPAVHRATIYCGHRVVLALHFEDSRRATEMLRQACRSGDGTDRR